MRNNNSLLVCVLALVAAAFWLVLAICFSIISRQDAASTADFDAETATLLLILSWSTAIYAIITASVSLLAYLLNANVLKIVAFILLVVAEILFFLFTLPLDLASFVILIYMSSEVLCAFLALRKIDVTQNKQVRGNIPVTNVTVAQNKTGYEVASLDDLLNDDNGNK